MAPEGFANFFLASAGSGGAFVGLLFVAISIGPQRTFGDLPVTVGPRQYLAEAALLTLVNGFVVSSIALIPDVNVGGFAVAMGLFGAYIAGRLAVTFVRGHRHEGEAAAPLRHSLRVASQSTIATVIFGGEVWLGARLMLHPGDRVAFRWLSVTIITLYTFALFRAWTLLGNPQRGLSGWLNPFHDPKRDTERGTQR